jgi:hypothetical protein
MSRRFEKWIEPWIQQTAGCAKRQRLYGALERDLLHDQDSIRHQRGRVMASFKAGLFAGGGRGDWPRDNLDLERWFRLPKGHERRIHGRCHAGVRIVQEGATMMLALDAHRHHPQPFTEEQLRAYRDAEVPDTQKEVLHRRKVMRAARSPKKRAGGQLRLVDRRAESFVSTAITFYGRWIDPNSGFRPTITHTTSGSGPARGRGRMPLLPQSTN